MRNWKRILGLSKLSAMAALVLSSCGHNDDGEQRFVHTGQTQPWGSGWTYDLRPDAAGVRLQDMTIKDYIVTVAITDTDADAEIAVHEKECITYNPRVYKVALDLRTDDSVLLKQIVPHYDSNTPAGSPEKLDAMFTKTWNQDRQTRVSVDFYTPSAEHHVHDAGRRVLTPDDIIRVTRDSIAR